MLTEQSLNQFTGTEKYYSYLCGLKLTDGVHYLATEGKCFWLLDIIVSYQPKHHQVPFQLWELNIDEEEDKRTAVITMREDTGKKALVQQRIPYTDFPLDYLKLYVVDKVVLLPSEY